MVELSRTGDEVMVPFRPAEKAELLPGGLPLPVSSHGEVDGVVHMAPHLVVPGSRRRGRDCGLAGPVAPSAVATTCFGLGTLGARGETAALIGPLSPRTLAARLGIESARICAGVRRVARVASVARGMASIAGPILASWPALGFLGRITRRSSWSPSTLARSRADLAGPHGPGVPWHARARTLLATGGLVTAATRRATP